MHLEFTYEVAAPVPRVWDVLMDTGRIAACLPGCRALRPLGDDRYEAELSVAVAAVSGEFKGTVTLRDQMPPESYVLELEGTGRPGFVKGRARVVLAPRNDATSVHIAADAEVGGLIARVGQRLLEGVARMMADRFFACLARDAEQQSSRS